MDRSRGTLLMIRIAITEIAVAALRVNMVDEFDGRVLAVGGLRFAGAGHVRASKGASRSSYLALHRSWMLTERALG
jgi:hypothetical protein